MVVVIYLLTCENCQIQYVGETGQKLSRRTGQHRRSIEKYGSSSCRLINEHFTTENCKDKKFSVQIIEILKDNGAQSTKIRREREKFWIKELHTLSPYGLNIRLENAENSNNAAETMMHSTRRRTKRGKKHKPIAWNEDDVLRMIKALNVDMEDNRQKGIFTCRKLICTMSIKTIKIMEKIIHDYATYKIKLHYLLVPIYNDMITFKNQKTNRMIIHERGIKRKQKEIVVMEFVNKGMEMINLPGIFRKPEINDLLPGQLKNATTTIAWKY